MMNARNIRRSAGGLTKTKQARVIVRGKLRRAPCSLRARNTPSLIAHEVPPIPARKRGVMRESKRTCSQKAARVTE